MKKAKPSFRKKKGLTAQIKENRDKLKQNKPIPIIGSKGQILAIMKPKKQRTTKLQQIIKGYNEEAIYIHRAIQENKKLLKNLLTLH